MRTIWRLHSGELFGEIGRFAVDTLALALLVLCITGLIITFFPRITHRLQVKRRRAANRFTLQSLRWHNRIGVSTLVFVFVLTLTGMFLRPPLLILIAGGKHAPVPHTVEDSPNPWWDELRMVRRDTARGEWLFLHRPRLSHSAESRGCTATGAPRTAHGLYGAECASTSGTR